MKSLFKLCVLALFTLLGACSTIPRVESDVSRFHKLPPRGNGQTFAIEAAGDYPELEFATYASRVAAYLQTYGWARSGGARADYMVRLSYRRGASRQILDSTPIIGPVDSGVSYHVGTVTTHKHNGHRHDVYSGATYNSPALGVVGAQPYSYTVHDRHLDLEIRDRRGRSVFEGRATSTGPNPELSAVIPAMIDAVFTGFPGESGSPVHVVVKSR